MLLSFYIVLLGFPGASSSKESAFSGGDPVRKIPWRRGWQPTPVFLPGEFHGQSSLAGYSPRDHKESDMTEQLTLSTSLKPVFWPSLYTKKTFSNSISKSFLGFLFLCALCRGPSHHHISAPAAGALSGGSQV